jgi:hypothetical protein
MDVWGVSLIRYNSAVIFLLVGMGVSLILSGQAPVAPYDVGPNVQVSSSMSTVRHYETDVGADPRHANRLIACAYVVRPDDQIDNVFYISTDHGKRWSHALTVPNAVDPSCGIGPDGVPFAASVHDQAFPDGKTDSVLAVYRSADGGRQWQASSVTAETRGIDRAWVTVDDGGPVSAYRVFVHGYYARMKPPPAATFYMSTETGRSFGSTDVRPATTFAKPWFFPGNGVVSNGNFFALLAELDNAKRNMSYKTDAASAMNTADGVLSVYRSLDGGNTVELAGQIKDAYYDWRVPDLSMPSLAVDQSRGAFRGRLYAAWPDARYGNRTQILLSYSSDQGRTWTQPSVVSDDSKAHNANDHADNFMPKLAVNRDGVVGLLWYDRRDNPDNVGYWARFSASLDGGDTWLPSVRASAAPNTASDDTRKNGGDTVGLAADRDGIFHPVWIDNRTGIPQMWTATVKVRGRARR